MSDYYRSPTELSPRQSQCLALISDSLARTGCSPTVAEITAALGISSSSMVQYCLDVLEAKGFISRRPFAHRSISVVGREQHQASCFCAPCAEKKFAYGLRLHAALNTVAPANLHGIKLVGIKHISPSSSRTRTRGNSLAGKTSGMSAAGEGSNSKASS